MRHFPKEITKYFICFLKKYLALFEPYIADFRRSRLVFIRRFSLKGKMPDYSSDSFLVGAFSLEEKSPTLTVSSFFSVDNLTLSGPLFLQFVHLSYLFIFDQAGERGFDSRTKP